MNPASFLRVPLFLFTLSATAACNKGDRSNPAPLVYKEEKNIAYGPHAQQQLDIYLPANRTAFTTPVVLFIHGGGWKEGDKTNFDALNAYGLLTGNGYAVVNMNYRLVTDQAFEHPTQLEDIDSVMAFIARKQSDWGVDANRVCMLGGSAGGHLSLLWAYSRNSAGRVKCVVDFFGPTDFTHTSIKDQLAINLIVANYLGTLHDWNPALWRSASPAMYTATAVPTLILQGGADPLVFPVQSTLLRDSLQAHGVAHQYVYYPAEGHGWDGAELEDSKTKTVDFLAAHLR